MVKILAFHSLARSTADFPSPIALANFSSSGVIIATFFMAISCAEAKIRVFMSKVLVWNPIKVLVKDSPNKSFCQPYQNIRKTTGFFWPRIHVPDPIDNDHHQNLSVPISLYLGYRRWLHDHCRKTVFFRPRNRGVMFPDTPNKEKYFSLFPGYPQMPSQPIDLQSTISTRPNKPSTKAPIPIFFFALFFTRLLERGPSDVIWGATPIAGKPFFLPIRFSGPLKRMLFYLLLYQIVM